MTPKIKFVHTNIVAKDWKKLAQFYIDVFDCKPILPERDLKGEWVEKLTHLKNAKIKGIHLQLPGYENGPTLEIFEYEPKSGVNQDHKINDWGFAHIAFLVDDVDTVLKKFLSSGGKMYGELTEKEIPGVGTLTAVYVQDPENNIVEIQNWK